MGTTAFVAGYYHVTYFYESHQALNPLTPRVAKTGLTISEIFFQQKHFLGKKLKEKCLREIKQQLSFKYFVNFCLIPKLL